VAYLGLGLEALPRYCQCLGLAGGEDKWRFVGHACCVEEVIWQYEVTVEERLLRDVLSICREELRCRGKERESEREEGKDL
jgi:hypothetical protein